jgi:t-SNARE complex subunit (syntaxin)
MMASYYDAKARAATLVDNSLTDIAEMLIDLEEKVEAQEATIDALEDELAEARAGE